MESEIVKNYKDNTSSEDIEWLGKRVSHNMLLFYKKIKKDPFGDKVNFLRTVYPDLEKKTDGLIDVSVLKSDGEIFEQINSLARRYGSIPCGIETREDMLYQTYSFPLKLSFFEQSVRKLGEGKVTGAILKLARSFIE